MTQFDSNQCNLLKSLLDLKETCFFWEKNFLGEAFYNTNQNQYSFLYYQSFYSSFRDVIDLVIFFLVNEEISNSTGRSGFEKLLKQVLTIDTSKRNFYSNEKHFRDLKYLFINHYNSMLGSMMLDFTVSSFSTFENWINYLFESDLCKEQKNLIIESREKNIRNVLVDKSNIEEKLNKIMKLRTGNFFSLPDKLECIYKMINDNKRKYKEDWKNDKEIIDFLAARRNTVHNQGIHRGKDKVREVNNKKFILREGSPYNTNSWIDDIKILEELIRIYTNLLDSIPKETRRKNINSFIIPQCDYTKISILTKVIIDYLPYLDSSNEYQKDMLNTLMSEFNLSETQSKNIIREINKTNCEIWKEEDTFHLLSIFNPKE